MIVVCPVSFLLVFSTGASQVVGTCLGWSILHVFHCSFDVIIARNVQNKRNSSRPPLNHTAGSSVLSVT